MQAAGSGQQQQQQQQHELRAFTALQQAEVELRGGGSESPAVAGHRVPAADAPLQALTAREVIRACTTVCGVLYPDGKQLLEDPSGALGSLTPGLVHAAAARLGEALRLWDEELIRAGARGVAVYKEAADAAGRALTTLGALLAFVRVGMQQLCSCLKAGSPQQQLGSYASAAQLKALAGAADAVGEALRFQSEHSDDLPEPERWLRAFQGAILVVRTCSALYCGLGWSFEAQKPGVDWRSKVTPEVQQYLHSLQESGLSAAACRMLLSPQRLQPVFATNVEVTGMSAHITWMGAMCDMFSCLTFTYSCTLCPGEDRTQHPALGVLLAATADPAMQRLARAVAAALVAMQQQLKHQQRQAFPESSWRARCLRNLPGADCMAALLLAGGTEPLPASMLPPGGMGADSRLHDKVADALGVLTLQLVWGKEPPAAMDAAALLQLHLAAYGMALRDPDMPPSVLGAVATHLSYPRLLMLPTGPILFADPVAMGQAAGQVVHLQLAMALAVAERLARALLPPPPPTQQQRQPGLPVEGGPERLPPAGPQLQAQPQQPFRQQQQRQQQQQPTVDLEAVLLKALPVIGTSDGAHISSHPNMTTAARTHFANELVQCGARRLADELLRLVVRLAPHVRSGARLVCTCCVAASLVLADADGKLVWQCRSTEDVGLVPRTAQSPYVLPEQVEMAGGVSPKVRRAAREVGVVLSALKAARVVVPLLQQLQQQDLEADDEEEAATLVQSLGSLLLGPDDALHRSTATHCVEAYAGEQVVLMAAWPQALDASIQLVSVQLHGHLRGRPRAAGMQRGLYSSDWTPVTAQLVMDAITIASLQLGPASGPEPRRVPPSTRAALLQLLQAPAVGQLLALSAEYLATRQATRGQHVRQVLDMARAAMLLLWALACLPETHLMVRGWVLAADGAAGGGPAALAAWEAGCSAVSAAGLTYDLSALRASRLEEVARRHDDSRGKLQRYLEHLLLHLRTTPGDTAVAWCRCCMPPEFVFRTLVLKPAEVQPSADAGRALLRLCSHPACTNLEGASEQDLPRLQCARCKAAWYCSAACQKAHWRAGHKQACAAPPP